MQVNENGGMTCTADGILVLYMEKAAIIATMPL